MMSRCFIVVVWVCVCCALVPAVLAVTGNPGHDRMYGDMPGMPLSLGTQQTADDCRALCMKNATCKGWVYAPINCNSSPTSPLCWLKESLGNVIPVNPPACRTSGTKDMTLLQRKFTPYPLGSIAPQGWLKNQLQLQATGLCGYLSQFWPSISQSAWIGVNGGDTFERVPYWLNGLVPLAFQLNDATLFAQMHKYIDYILDHQTSDGWIGPTCCDPWPRFPMLLALVQYHEANSSDTRVVPAITKFLLKYRSVIESTPLDSWAQYRVHDLILVIHWIFEKYPQGQEQIWLDLAEVSYQQGFDWGAFFDSSSFPKGPCTGSCPNLATHGVNNGQALKSGAVWYRQSKQKSDVDSSFSRVSTLYKYHGMANGIFGCDEHLAGNMPSHGSELCTVVETMFSFEEMYSIIGDTMFGDYVEKLTFNALPATMTADLWAHQYLQQSNEINAAHNDPHIYVTDGPDSNIYGLEPNFGCCTANFPQGWPKFASHLYFQSQDDGILAGLYAPSTLTTTIGNSKVTITQDTTYPFSPLISFVITTQVGFPFYLRIPAWAKGAYVQVNGGNSQPASPGTNFQVKIASGQTKLSLNLPMSWNIERRYNNAAALHYGPLLFAMNIPADWTNLHHYAFNSSDWQLLPTGPWALALDIADENPEKYLKVTTRAMGNQPFSESGSPIVATANARPITWGTSVNAAQAPPTSPVKASSNPIQVTLLPYGATKLRIAEMPTLN